MRFPNEADMVRDLDGVLLRVDRDTGLNDSHSSETSLDLYRHFDFRIVNDGSMEDLESRVVGVVTEIYKREPMLQV